MKDEKRRVGRTDAGHIPSHPRTAGRPFAMLALLLLFVTVAQGGSEAATDSSDASQTVVVRCEWCDFDNAFGSRPESVDVAAFTNDVAYKTVSVTSNGNWLAKETVSAVADDIVLSCGVANGAAGYVSSVKRYGCLALADIKMSDSVLTRDGWQTCGDLPLKTEIYTEDGWMVVADVELAQAVVVKSEGKRGFFVVTNCLTNEPGPGRVPYEGLSKFDTKVYYDGKGHTIDTNELQAAFAKMLTGECVFEYAAEDADAVGGGTPTMPWQADVPVYTNVGGYVVWYKVANSNYTNCDFVHAAKVTIWPNVKVMNLRVTQIEPWGLALDYDVEDAISDYVLEVKVITDGGAVTNVAKTLVGDVGCVNGAHRVYWNMAKDGLSFDPTTASLKVSYRYPRYCVIDLEGGAESAHYPVSYLASEPEGGFTNDTYKTTKLVLKRVKAGTFIMGEDQTNEAHRVTLTKSFYMGLFEVTQKQWELVMGSPTIIQPAGDMKPVEWVSYYMIRGSKKGDNWPDSDAVDGESEGDTCDSFLGRLRKRTGGKFDLPTVAQWEYACRAGTTTEFSFGDGSYGDYMWCRYNADCAHEVGTRLPNPWGFYDMHGNVWEWCLDWQSDVRDDPLSDFPMTLVFGKDPRGGTCNQLFPWRVARGGGYVSDDYGLWACNSFSPLYYGPGESNGGFRLAMIIPSPADENATPATDSAPVTVDFALGRILADGSEIDGAITIGYAPHGTTNAIVTINGEKFVEASEAGSRLWTPTKGGEYALKHAVGDIALEATYTVLSHDLDIDDGNNGEGGENSRFSYSGVYDGQGHGIAVEVGEEIANPTIAYSLNKAGPYCESVLITNVCEVTPVWYTIEVAGYNTYTNWATVMISPRPVTITSGTKTDFVYDGTAHGFPVIAISGTGFVAGEGIVTSNWASVTTVAQGEVANTFDYAANEGTDRANYAITVVTGKIAVVKAKVGPTGGDEPGSGEIGDGGLSKFDATFVYDGAGHTIKTNELAAAFAEAMGVASKETKIWYATNSAAGGGTPALPWVVDTPVYTNVGEYVVWYKVTNPNYEDYVHAAKVTITPRMIDPSEIFGGSEKDDQGRIVCKRVYNGAAQAFVVAPDFDEPYRLSYALVSGDESAYSETAPTRTHVAEGDLVVYFKFVSTNYEPYYGVGVLRIAAKALTDEMCVADEDAAWFYDGTEKKPAVTVVDGSPNIATTNDYTLTYSGRTGAGLFPVTVTGTNDYAGVVTKEFAIMKRPVVPPTIPSTSYNGRTRKATVPKDERWEVASNPGGVDVGAYTNVVLKLTNPDDYRWKGLDEDEEEWTGVLVIVRGPNGWSRLPGIDGWTEGETASEPNLGQPRNGAVSKVLYFARGADVATATETQPTKAGLYTARFVVEETSNYVGTTYDVDFEIAAGAGGDATTTTPVPVPYAWLKPYLSKCGAGDYEAAGNATGANGVTLWESYVAGLDPTDKDSQFRAEISVDSRGNATLTWQPDLSNDATPRVYTTFGKADLRDVAWTVVTDANKASMRFFKVEVKMK